MNLISLAIVSIYSRPTQGKNIVYCEEGRNQNTFFHKSMALSLKASVWLETETCGRMETATLTHNFFWPYNIVLSLRPHLALLLHLSQEILNQRPLWSTVCYLQGLISSLPKRRTQPVLIRGGGRVAPCSHHSPSSDSTDDCKLALTQDSHCRRCYSHEHLHKWFRNTHTFPFQRDCFHLFSQVLPVKRISDWRLGQESICNKNATHGHFWSSI